MNTQTDINAAIRAATRIKSLDPHTTPASFNAQIRAMATRQPVKESTDEGNE